MCWVSEDARRDAQRDATHNAERRQQVLTAPLPPPPGLMALKMKPAWVPPVLITIAQLSQMVVGTAVQVRGQG